MADEFPVSRSFLGQETLCDRGNSVLRFTGRGTLSGMPNETDEQPTPERREVLDRMTEEWSELWLYEASADDYASALRSARRRRSSE